MSIDAKQINKAISILIKAVNETSTRCLLCRNELPTVHSGRKYCHKDENPKCVREQERIRKQNQRKKKGTK